MHALLAARERFRAEILHGQADFLRRGRRGQGLSKSDSHGIRNLARKFPEKFAARKTEDRAPHAVQIHGNDGNVYAFDDAFHAAAEGQHLADPRHLAFREDANDFAILQRVSCQSQGMNHFPRPLVRRDGNHSHDSCEWFYERVLVGPLEHQKTDGTID